MGSTFVAVWFGGVIAAVVFEAFTKEPDWHQAFDRLFFQAAALATVWFSLWLKGMCQ